MKTRNGLIVCEPPISHVIFGPLVTVLIVSALAFFVTVLVASAHQAPSGWTYPAECCNEHDCEPIACDSVTETKSGLLWKSLEFTGNQIKATGDKDCHACAAKDGTGKPTVPRYIFIHPTT